MKGKVYLVGAGPGDYKLMTLKGLEVIKKADLIYYDRLVNPAYLKEAKEGCRLIYVGKESSNHTLPQEEINKTLAAGAKEGKLVVRLKGGDPYVFGRGGEEGEILYEEGVEFEVIPGITSAIGGLCYAGIPITHREYASSFHVFTGHLKDPDRSLDWSTISALKGTLVFLMGVSNLQIIAEKLAEYGKDGNTPAAVINWGTCPNQKVVTGNLENIYERAVEEELQSPCLIVVGDVVSLREKLNFFERSPLFGKNIIVTRAREQSSTLLQKISELGGNGIEVPAIKIKKVETNEELEEAIANLDTYSYVIFTSVNGVDIFFEKLSEMGRDSRALYTCRIAVIGSATAEALEKYGLKPDIIPKRFVSEDLVEGMKSILGYEDRILIPRAREARRYLSEELSNICTVNEISTYDTVIDESGRESLLQSLKDGIVDYITFTSSSTVNNFIQLLGKANMGLLEGVKLISIGPVTSSALTGYGLKVYREAEEYTIDGVIKCITEDKIDNC
ncbi:MAG: uroporphyrinogen-III C-methyltransferase [Bacillota bacterium]|nr:uroporphyrinogen-III C-methyltransferase [Bacillota bacterium]